MKMYVCFSSAVPRVFRKILGYLKNVMKAFEAGEKISWGFGKCRERMLTF